MSAPYMPLFVSDYLADTAHLTAVDHGAYLMLLMNYWQRGKPLPADDRKLARIARMTDEQWADARDTLAEFFQEEAGEWRHGRVEKEIAVAAEKSAKAKASARASVDARKAASERLFNERSTNVELLGEVRIGAVKELYPDTLNQAEPFVGSQANATQLQVSDQKPKGQETKTRNRYPDDFEAFWTGYPTDANMSKKEAHDVWKRISSDNKRLAVESLPAFRAHCTSNPDYRPIHACRYLSKERFAGHIATAQKITSRKFIEKGSGQWRAWEAHYRKMGKTGPPSMQSDVGGRMATGWTFDSEWPPQGESRAA
jgi:uncharacterized protein YdaU (DUF1376 family)